MKEIIHQGPPEFDPAKELPDGFNQVLMKEFFYSSLEEINPCMAGILDLLTKHKYVQEESHVMQIRLCLDEALVNAVKHGNKLDASKRVHITVYGGKNSWAIRIEDEGEGFTLEDLPDYEDEETLLLEGGRGVLLIREFMSEVYYYDRGNRVLMIKHLDKKA